MEKKFEMSTEMYPERMQVISWLSQRLKTSRFVHTLGVEECACKCALRYGVDVRKASLAALLHDCAKNMDEKELLDIVIAHEGSSLQLEEYPQILHAFAAPYVAQKEFGTLDPEILSAIRYHSTGSLDMSMLDLIIFCADFAEPSRHGYEELGPARKLIEEDLTQAAIYIMEATAGWVKERGLKVYPLTMQALEVLKNKIRS